MFRRISVDEYFYPDDYSGLYYIYFLYTVNTYKELLRNGVNKMFDFFGGCHTYARF